MFLIIFIIRFSIFKCIITSNNSATNAEQEVSNLNSELAQARADLIERVEKATFVPPPPPEKPSEFE